MLRLKRTIPMVLFIVKTMLGYFLYSQSLFLYEGGLTQGKENDFKDTADDKRQKTQVFIKEPPHKKKAKNHKVNHQAFKKISKS